MNVHATAGIAYMNLLWPGYAILYTVKYKTGQNYIRLLRTEFTRYGYPGRKVYMSTHYKKKQRDNKPCF